jgi:hypothetical protein
MAEQNGTHTSFITFTLAIKKFTMASRSLTKCPFLAKCC